MSVSETGRGETGDGIEHERVAPYLPATRTTLVFVRVVAAVVVVVALPAAWNAAVVLASELVRLTGPLRCTSHRQSDRWY